MLSPPRLLLVDDDTDLTALISEFLESRGLQVDTVEDGAVAVDRARSGEYSLVILDVMLPALDGFEVLRRLRASGPPIADIPVVMLTAQGDEIDRIVGLELGADDYLPKPFNPRELLARVRAILRRAELRAAALPASGPEENAAESQAQTDSEAKYSVQVAGPAEAPGKAAGQPNERLICGDIEVDVEARTAWLNGGEIELTAAEFDLLRVLIRSAGRVVERDKLATEALQRRLSPFDRSLDIHMSKLRRKLEPSKAIKTVRGIGYILTRPAERQS